ncbi:MAG: hypothetical protein E7112_05220 [Bacteroidales bacterium]|nr:hypothetical protein [Bacteroidales bacterium]
MTEETVKLMHNCLFCRYKGQHEKNSTDHSHSGSSTYVGIGQVTEYPACQMQDTDLNWLAGAFLGTSTTTTDAASSRS